jgi:hypothetical protein
MGGMPLDTHNPTSKLMLTILAGVATWEREIMLERQREGQGQGRGQVQGAQVLAGMGKLFRIGMASVGHHRAQFNKPRLGKEQSWQPLAGVEPHQPTVHQRSGDRRDLRLTRLRPTAPGLELEPSATVGNVEKNMSSSRRIYARSPGVNR